MNKLDSGHSFMFLLAALLGVCGFFIGAPGVSADAGLLITQITPVKTSATADGTFANGWSWTFDVTAPTNETVLNVKFGNWVSGVRSIAAANNMRFFSAQSLNAVDAAHAITLTTADTFSSNIFIDPAIDLDSISQNGRQVQITVQVAVPVGSTGGSYATNYGVQSNVSPGPFAIVAPATQTFEATGSISTPTLLPATTTGGIDPNPVITFNANPFVLGANLVIWKAQDAFGHVLFASSQVIINDTTGPVITNTPLDITAEVNTVVNYTTPTATDLVDGVEPVTCFPASGFTFAVGTTTVTCNATDASSNNSHTTFTITVEDHSTPAPSQDSSDSPDPNATPPQISGCTNHAANNFNGNATVDDGSCTFIVLGCTNPFAINFSFAPNQDDGSCIFNSTP